MSNYLNSIKPGNNGSGNDDLMKKLSSALSLENEILFMQLIRELKFPLYHRCIPHRFKGANLVKFFTDSEKLSIVEKALALKKDRIIIALASHLCDVCRKEGDGESLETNQYGLMFLVYAIVNNNHTLMDIVIIAINKRWIDPGVDICYTDDDDCDTSLPILHPLTLSIASGHEEMARKLMELEAVEFDHEDQWIRALHQAITCKSPLIPELLAAMHARFDNAGTYDVPISQYCVGPPSHWYDIPSRNDDGVDIYRFRTALVVAIECSNLDLVKRLIKQENSPINQGGLCGVDTPLVVAAARGSTDILAAILFSQHFDDDLAIKLDSGTTISFSQIKIAFNSAIAHGNVEAYQYLCDYLLRENSLSLVDVIRKDYLDLTPIEYPLHLPFDIGGTPLIAAILHGQKEILDNMLKTFLVEEISEDFNFELFILALKYEKGDTVLKENTLWGMSLLMLIKNTALNERQIERLSPDSKSAYSSACEIVRNFNRSVYHRDQIYNFMLNYKEEVFISALTQEPRLALTWLLNPIVYSLSPKSKYLPKTMRRFMDGGRPLEHRLHLALVPNRFRDGFFDQGSEPSPRSIDDISKQLSGIAQDPSDRLDEIVKSIRQCPDNRREIFSIIWELIVKSRSAYARYEKIIRRLQSLTPEPRFDFRRK